MKDPILSIPDDVQKDHIVLAGITGAGKSNTAKTIAEYNLWKNRRFCVIDVTGDWHGLKSDRTGTKAGFPVIVFGGDHADIPLDDTMGAKLGELIATTNTPAVIDLQHFSPERMAKFLTTFFEVLYRLNREVIHVVLDEAHRYIPQQPRPEQAKLIHRVTDMVTGGRSRGFKFMIITQRPARIHKDPVAMAKCFILHEVTSSHDRKAIAGWMEDAESPDQIKTVTGSLPSMPTGEAWVWIPKRKHLERTKFPLAQTFDSGKAPEDGETKAEPTKLAFVDLDAIRAMLAPKAKAQPSPRPTASTSGILKHTDADLDQAVEEAVARNTARMQKEHAAQIAAMRKTWDAQIAKLRKSATHLVVATKGAADVASGHYDVIASMTSPDASTPTTAPPQAASAPLPIVSVTPRPAAPPRDDDSGISNTERKFLNAVRFWADLGYDAPSREQVAAVAGYPVSSGSTKNSLGALTSKGLTHYPTQGYVSMTQDGAAIAETPNIEPSTSGIRQAIDRVLDKAMRLFLDAAIAAYPNELSREEAADIAGYPVTSGSTKNALGALRSLEAITYPSQGMIKAAGWFFPGEK